MILQIIKSHTKFIVLLFVTLCATSVYAQKMEVKSFKLSERTISANIEGANKRIDQNGEVAALIKVQTTETGFAFEGGLLGIVDTKQDVGEIYVWVPRGAKRITIKHQKFGVLNYWYSTPIESGNTYEMLLSTPEVPNIADKSKTNSGQYLVLNIVPKNAEVVIDGKNIDVIAGSASVRLLPGRHYYEVKSVYHEPKSGYVDIVDKKMVLPISLTPQYGILHITSNPTGAEVYIDGDYQSAGKTPFDTRWLTAGSHTLQFKLPGHKPRTYSVDVIGDGSTKEFNAKLSSNQAFVNITAPDNAEIYVNNEYKGIGLWSGNLLAGIYEIEARKVSHRNSHIDISINAGDDKDIKLPSPTPIYGGLDINTTPIDAQVLIDGNEIGSTPDVWQNILVGEHKLQIIKPGYKPMQRTIRIEENKVQTLEFTLTTGTDEYDPVPSQIAPPKKSISRGYQGYVETGTSLGASDIWIEATWAFYTSHGYMFNPYIYLGMGIGYEIGAVGSGGFCMLPIFVEFRSHFINPNKRRHVPFGGFRIGGSAVDYYTSGFYANLFFGYRFKPKNIYGAFNLSIGYQTHHVYGEETYSYYDDYRWHYEYFGWDGYAHAATLRIGYEF